MGDTDQTHWVAVAGAAPGAVTGHVGAGGVALDAGQALQAKHFWSVMRGRIKASETVARAMQKLGNFVCTEDAVVDVFLLPQALGRAGVPLSTSAADSQAGAALAWIGSDGGAATFAWLEDRGRSCEQAEPAGYSAATTAMDMQDPERMREVLASDEYQAITLAIKPPGRIEDVVKLYAVEKPNRVQSVIAWAVKEMTCRAIVASEAGAKTDARLFNDFIGRIQVMLGRQGYEKFW
jgi:hypothetical protein